MISGVEIKELNTHKDERGFFCEIIRDSDKFFQGSFAQLSHSLAHTGIIKAWHMHKIQTEWLYVAAGEIKLALFDFREDSSTYHEIDEFLLGESRGRKVIKVPPGVAHGYKITQGPMHIFYVANREYVPKDDIKIPHDDPRIGYDWINTTVK